MDFIEDLLKDDEDMYIESMQNAYLIITDKLTFEELVEYNGCALPFNPKEGITVGIISEIIDYFISTEEYEKCSELKIALETREYEKNFINL